MCRGEKSFALFWQGWPPDKQLLPFLHRGRPPCEIDRLFHGVCPEGSYVGWMPDQVLHDFLSCIDALLADVEKEQYGEKSLKGIWKGSGFEKLVDLEEVEVSKISFQD